MSKDHIKPDHYKGKKFSPWEVIEEYFRDKWHVGTAFKYMGRMGKKIYPGCTAKESELHDTRKAIKELQRHEELLVDEISNGEGSDRKANPSGVPGHSFRYNEYPYLVDHHGNLYKHEDGNAWKRVPYPRNYFSWQ